MNPTIRLSLRSRWLIVMFAAVFLMAAAGNVSAEHVFIKDGGIIEGKVIEDTRKAVTVATKDGQRKSIPRENIIRILYSDEFLTKSVVQLTDGQIFEGFIVGETRQNITLRTRLTDPAEQVITKDQIAFTEKKRPSKLIARLIKGGFLLKWNKPRGAIKNFVVFMKEPGGEYREAAESNKPEVVLKKGIKEGTAYVFMVKIVDDDGYISPPSNELAVTSLKKGESPPVYPEDEEAEKKAQADKPWFFAVGPIGAGSIGAQFWNGKEVMAGSAGGGLRIETARSKESLMSFITSVSCYQHYNYRYVNKPIVYILQNIGGSGYDFYQTAYYTGKESVNPVLIEISQAFGFGLVRTPLVRYWLGPELVLNIATNGKKTYIGASGGLGFATGVNINPGSLITITIAGSCRVLYSYRYMMYRLFKTSDPVISTLPPGTPYVPKDPMKKKHDQTHGFGVMGHLTIGVMFRVSGT